MTLLITHKKEVILVFNIVDKTDYEFSNFFPLPFFSIIIKGQLHTFATVENAFQALKFVLCGKEKHEKECCELFTLFKNATPSELKNLERKDAEYQVYYYEYKWRQFKGAVLRELLSIKFTKYPFLREKLLNTASCVLFEKSEIYRRESKTFGVDAYMRGENLLGLLLMQVRKKMQASYYDQLQPAGFPFDFADLTSLVLPAVDRDIQTKFEEIRGLVLFYGSEEYLLRSEKEERDSLTFNLWTTSASFSASFLSWYLLTPASLLSWLPLFVSTHIPDHTESTVQSSRRSARAINIVYWPESDGYMSSHVSHSSRKDPSIASMKIYPVIEQLFMCMGMDGLSVAVSENGSAMIFLCFNIAESSEAYDQFITFFNPVEPADHERRSVPHDIKITGVQLRDFLYKFKTVLGHDDRSSYFHLSTDILSNQIISEYNSWCQWRQSQIGQRQKIGMRH